MNALSFRSVALVACTFALIFACSDASGSVEKKSQTRSDCDHIIPLMMMLGGSATSHLPSMWILGAFSLGAVVYFSNWSFSFGKKEEDER